MLLLNKLNYNIYYDNKPFKQDKKLLINYSFHETQFSKVLLASTDKGLCFLTFSKNKNYSLNLLYKKFPNVYYKEKIDEFHTNSLLFFINKTQNNLPNLKLHLKGTDFQIKVWTALLTIPPSQLTTYSKIANFIGNPKAFRAVGNAIGKNPICFIIPCHRVIKTNGNIGGYAFGANIKQNIIDWEMDI